MLLVSATLAGSYVGLLPAIAQGTLHGACRRRSATSSWRIVVAFSVDASADGPAATSASARAAAVPRRRPRRP
jgi:hypothetical protein